MKVLINAYACSPYMGSEPGMAWNWCTNLAKYCELFIITEGEFRDKIESIMPTLPQEGNMHFYYLPIGGNDNLKSEKIRKMCWNQGDWRFYWYYAKWQKRALKLAQEIVDKEQIDVLHQLNMVGFREPGYLWKLGVPLVWGPIGGMGDINVRFLKGAPIRTKLFIRLKNVITNCQLMFSYRVRKTINHSSALISAVPDTQKKLRHYFNRDSIWIPETGCYNLNNVVVDKRTRRDFHILWVGRFIYTKRLDIALRSIAEVKGLPNLHFHIVGTGNDEEVEKYKELGYSLGIDTLCSWHGKLDNSKVHEMMRNADVFFFTSIAEATSTVIPEAINNCLPVLCFDACGFAPIVTEKIGRKVKMDSQDKSVKEFAKHINMLYNNKQLLYEMSVNCKEALKVMLWEDKALQVFGIYKGIVENSGKHEENI